MNKPDFRFTNTRAALCVYQTAGDPSLAGRYNPAFASIRATYRYMVECVEADNFYGAGNFTDDEYPRWRFRWPRVAAALDTIRLVVDHAMCDLFGHRYVAETCASGETASETVYCTRCGASHSHTYY